MLQRFRRGTKSGSATAAAASTGQPQSGASAPQSLPPPAQLQRAQTTSYSSSSSTRSVSTTAAAVGGNTVANNLFAVNNSIERPRSPVDVSSILGGPYSSGSSSSDEPRPQLGNNNNGSAEQQLQLQQLHQLQQQGRGVPTPIDPPLSLTQASINSNNSNSSSSNNNNRRAMGDSENVSISANASATAAIPNVTASASLNAGAATVAVAVAGGNLAGTRPLPPLPPSAVSVQQQPQQQPQQEQQQHSMQSQVQVPLRESGDGYVRDEAASSTSSTGGGGSGVKGKLRRLLRSATMTGPHPNSQHSGSAAVGPATHAPVQMHHQPHYPHQHQHQHQQHHQHQQQHHPQHHHQNQYIHPHQHHSAQNVHHPKQIRQLPAMIETQQESQDDELQMVSAASFIMASPFEESQSSSTSNDSNGTDSFLGVSNNTNNSNNSGSTAIDQPSILDSQQPQQPQQQILQIQQPLQTLQTQQLQQQQYIVTGDAAQSQTSLHSSSSLAGSTIASPIDSTSAVMPSRSIVSITPSHASSAASVPGQPTDAVSPVLTTRGLPPLPPTASTRGFLHRPKQTEQQQTDPAVASTTTAASAVTTPPPTTAEDRPNLRTREGRRKAMTKMFGKLKSHIGGAASAHDATSVTVADFSASDSVSGDGSTNPLPSPSIVAPMLYPTPPFAKISIASNQSVFGLPLDAAAAASCIRPQFLPIPAVIERCLAFLNKFGINEVGVFRIPGSTATVNKVKAWFDGGNDRDLIASATTAQSMASGAPATSSMGGLGGYRHDRDKDVIVDVHCVATLFKMFFRELPDSILTTELLPEFNAVLNVSYHTLNRHVLMIEQQQRNTQQSIYMERLQQSASPVDPPDDTIPASLLAFAVSHAIDESNHALNSPHETLLRDEFVAHQVALLARRLTPATYHTLRVTSSFLKKLAANSDVNKMTLQNLCLILCSSLRMNAYVLRAMILHGDTIIFPVVQPQPPILMNDPATHDSLMAIGGGVPEMINLAWRAQYALAVTSAGHGHVPMHMGPPSSQPTSPTSPDNPDIVEGYQQMHGSPTSAEVEAEAARPVVDERASAAAITSWDVVDAEDSDNDEGGATDDANQAAAVEEARLAAAALNIGRTAGPAADINAVKAILASASVSQDSDDVDNPDDDEDDEDNEDDDDDDDDDDSDDTEHEYYEADVVAVYEISDEEDANDDDDDDDKDENGNRTQTARQDALSTEGIRYDTSPKTVPSGEDAWWASGQTSNQST
ncbi:hypothetical protein GQ42DRAFT_162520 [Ramicandelaber brevisporus]|nr:hypothetical protein GQ42DRAFT_162520 [Ramicandelaber brevisporus]